MREGRPVRFAGRRRRKPFLQSRVRRGGGIGRSLRARTKGHGAISDRQKLYAEIRKNEMVCRAPIASRRARRMTANMRGKWALKLVTWRATVIRRTLGKVNLPYTFSPQLPRRIEVGTPRRSRENWPWTCVWSMVSWFGERRPAQEMEPRCRLSPRISTSRRAQNLAPQSPRSTPAGQTPPSTQTTQSLLTTTSRSARACRRSIC